LADWIRGTAKPGFLELGAWDSWEQTARLAHPVRYWLAETALDAVEDIVRWPAEQINSVRYWLNNRFVSRTHALTSRLKPGAWHEFDERILHCLFDELVNFVEVEKAWMQVCWGDAATREKYALPFWRRQWWTRWFREWRCPQAGLDHLAWEISLVWTEDQVGADSKLLGQPTDQAGRAQEILDLYTWWTKTRPARPDPYEASGWTEYCEASRAATGGKLSFSGRGDSAELKRMSKDAHKQLDRMEADYEAEDTERLIQLIRIRKSLWT